MMKSHQSRIVLAIAVLPMASLVLMAKPAGAEVINVNHYDSQSGGIPEDPATLVGPAGGSLQTWNQFNTTVGNGLLDSTGAATGVGFVTDANLGWIWGNPTITMFHSAAIHFPKGNDTTFTINGLTAGSAYNVWIASAADNIPDERFHGNWSTSNITTTVGAQDIDNVTTDNTSTWEYGVNYVLFENVEADISGEITFIGDASDAGEFGPLDYRLGLSGWQIEEVLEPGFAYCPGDGTGSQCTCANNSAGPGGCDWSTSFPTGGVLAGSGSNIWTSNNTFLHATAIENNFGIFFGANNQTNGGAGNPLNDGLRCAGGGLIRLTAPTAATGNMADLPAPLQTLDTGAGPGMTRRYQYWFRTPQGPCGTLANLTNGYEISFL